MKEGLIKIKFNISTLTPEDGGGFLIEFPDFPGCMSDGETEEEAIANGLDALACWLQVVSSDKSAINITYTNS